MIEKVAVIGAGPGGLAAAKYLLAENTFSEIVVFEQRLNVGGVWRATPGIKADKYFTVPQTQPSTVPNEPVHVQSAKEGEPGFEFLSPIYDNLDTNIPQTLMKYSDHAFPEDTALFPRHEVVQEYLECYADKVRHLIRFGIQVLDVRPITDDSSHEKWSISTKDLKDGQELVSVFDAVVVSSGHYNDPYIPDIPGIREWDSAYPGSVTHSKFYRRPEDFKNKKVLIIGNSASGTDLATHIAPLSTLPLLISSRSAPSQLLPSMSLETLSLSEIAHFSALDRTIVFKDSHIEKDIDAIIFCTGYLFSFPFLASLDPPLIASDHATHGTEARVNGITIQDSLGKRVHNLYQHVFYRPRPTLSFIALPQRIIPFPLSESQASVIARFLSGRLKLPLEAEMADWEAGLLAEKRKEYPNGGGEEKFHLMGYPKDAEYVNFLYGWAMSVSGSSGDEEEGGQMGKSNGETSRGKVPPYWGPEELWVRERTPLIKKAARELGEKEKREIRSLKELGFDYEETAGR